MLHKPSKAEIKAAYNKEVPDIIAPDLKILFCGINASLYSAAVGHHFARPGNRFWKALHQAGFTERLLHPVEDQRLLQQGYGLTNIVARATARADELDHIEFQRGYQDLSNKVAKFRPRYLAILGITAYRIAFAQPKAKVGSQSGRLHDAQIWVLPNPSGLNAHYQIHDLARVYGALREKVDG